MMPTLQGGILAQQPARAAQGGKPQHRTSPPPSAAVRGHVDHATTPAHALPYHGFDHSATPAFVAQDAGRTPTTTPYPQHPQHTPIPFSGAPPGVHNCNPVNHMQPAQHTPAAWGDRQQRSVQPNSAWPGAQCAAGQQPQGLLQPLGLQQPNTTTNQQHQPKLWGSHPHHRHNVEQPTPQVHPAQQQYTPPQTARQQLQPTWQFQQQPVITPLAPSASPSAPLSTAMLPQRTPADLKGLTEEEFMELGELGAQVSQEAQQGPLLQPQHTMQHMRPHHPQSRLTPLAASAPPNTPFSAAHTNAPAPQVAAPPNTPFSAALHSPPVQQISPEEIHELTMLDAEEWEESDEGGRPRRISWEEIQELSAMDVQAAQEDERAARHPGGAAQQAAGGAPEGFAQEEEEEEEVLSDEQRAVLRRALEGEDLYITGGAGTVRLFEITR